MRGIITRAIVTRGIITCGTGHARNSLEWNTCRHKRAVNIRYSSAINLQKTCQIQSTTVKAALI